MNDRETPRYDMFGRVGAFYASNTSDFVPDLTAARAAKEDVESEDNEGVEGTAAVGRLIKAGMKEVNYLNAIMHNKYSRTADKLVAWKSASHIERAPKPKKAEAPSIPPSA